MKTLSRPIRQRGIVAVMAVIFLITAVIFVLTQTLNITGTASIDNTQQLDSTQALFLAESGLEQAHSKIALSKGNCCKFNATTCPNGFLDVTSIGSGSFSFLTPTASSSNCAVTVVGQVGTARRTISQGFNFAGTTAFCNAENATTADCSNSTATPPVNPTWSLTLRSGTGVGIFNLAADGNTGISSLYPVASLGSVKQWEKLGPSSTIAKVLGVGHTVVQQVADTSVYEVLNKSDSDTALSGAVFPGATIVGSYSDNTGTVGSTSIDGTTTNGLTGWCGGVSNGLVTDANTLVMGFSAHTNQAKTAGLSNVTFDSRGGSSIPMLPFARTPRIGNTEDALAGNDVYSEIWYKQNAPFHQGFWITGRIIGEPITLSKFKPTKDQGNGELTDANSAYTPGGNNIVLTVGMPLDVTGCPAASNPGTFVTITRFGPSCDITSNQNAVNGLKICWNLNQWTPSASGQCNVNAPASPSSTRLLVKNEHYQYGFGTVPSQSQTLAGQGVTNNTLIGASTNVPAGYSGYTKAFGLNTASAPTADIAMVVDGATITTSAVTLPTTHQPYLTTQPQIVSVIPLTILAPAVAGNSLISGQLPPNTILIGPTSPVLSGTTAAASEKNGAAILCGGTCAFFNHSTPSTSTTFKLSSSSSLPTGTDAWVAGFTCFSGAGVPQPVTGGGSATAGQWHEVIQ